MADYMKYVYMTFLCYSAYSLYGFSGVEVLRGSNIIVKYGVWQ